MARDSLLDTKQFCFVKHVEIKLLDKFERMPPLSLFPCLDIQNNPLMTWHTHHEQLPIRQHLHLAYLHLHRIPSAFTTLVEKKHFIRILFTCWIFKHGNKRVVEGREKLLNRIVLVFLWIRDLMNIFGCWEKEGALFHHFIRIINYCETNHDIIKTVCINFNSFIGIFATPWPDHSASWWGDSKLQTATDFSEWLSTSGNNISDCSFINWCAIFLKN